MTAPNAWRGGQPYLLLAVFFVLSAAFRPVLPVDETRYLTVAWEMWLRGEWLLPTMNFAPYLHKPPLLFWLLDGAFHVFGVNRAAALAVMFLIAALTMYLTARLAKRLYPDDPTIAARIPWLMLGSAPFALYATLILFDLLLTVWVLLFMLALLAFLRQGQLRFAVLAGLAIGMGVLAKGPVILIHVGVPVALYPLWRDPETGLPPRRLFASLPLMLVAALLPVAAWLLPLLSREGLASAYQLVWQQSAGRITGSMEGAHARPFYFYLVLAPIALLPWGLWPGLWRGEFRRDGDRRIDRLLAGWIIGVIAIFSAIAGKQPHYLVPLIVPATLLFARYLALMPLAQLRRTAVLTLALLAAGQAVASSYLHRRFDLQPFADQAVGNGSAGVAFAGDYQGQLGFLGRLREPMKVVALQAGGCWLSENPNGLLIVNAKRRLSGLQGEAGRQACPCGSAPCVPPPAP